MAAALRSGWVVAVLGILAGCGGGGDDNGGTSPRPGGGIPGGSNSYTPGVFQPSSSLAKQCVSPRAGSEDRQGTAQAEKLFLRS